MAELDDIREELRLAREEIAGLRIKATTTLSGTEFLTLLMVGPVIAAFVILGVIIVWKTTSNPDQVAPHLDIILVAFLSAMRIWRFISVRRRTKAAIAPNMLPITKLKNIARTTSTPILTLLLTYFRLPVMGYGMIRPNSP